MLLMWTKQLDLTPEKLKILAFAYAIRKRLEKTVKKDLPNCKSNKPTRRQKEIPG